MQVIEFRRQAQPVIHLVVGADIIPEPLGMIGFVMADGAPRIFRPDTAQFHNAQLAMSEVIQVETEIPGWRAVVVRMPE